MKKRMIGKSGIQAPALALGTWSMGGDAQWGVRDDSASIEAIKAAVDHGVNMIDTAPAYGFGESERVVGRAIRAFRREDLILETKCGVWWRDNEGTEILARDGKVIRRNLSPRAIKSDLEHSLKNLGTDYIDIYVTHQQSRPPFEVPIEQTMDTLLELKKEGKIRAIGASNLLEEEFEQYLKYADQLDLIQERFSMLDQKKVQMYIQRCEQHNISFQAYSPLEQGLLTGKIGMDYVLDSVNVRNKIPWFQPEKRRLVINMLDGWKPLCEKYHANLVNLVIAWTLAYHPNVLAIAGGRKIHHVLDYFKGGEMEIDAEDLRQMSADIARTCEAGAALDAKSEGRTV